MLALEERAPHGTSRGEIVSESHRTDVRSKDRQQDWGRPAKEEERPSSEGSSAQLLKAGQWHSSAYRPHLDLGAEEAAAMVRVLIEVSDDEVEPGGPGGKGNSLVLLPKRLGSDAKTIWGCFESMFPRFPYR